MEETNDSFCESLIKHIGGWENVSSLTHCMTRLRLTVYDFSLSDIEALKKQKGVMGVITNGSSIQIVIGNDVARVYAKLTSKKENPFNVKSKNGNGKNLFQRIGSAILDAIIGTMSPLIPAIIGGSVIKLIAMLLPLTGIINKESTTIQILKVIGDGAFFFLPIMVAASASIKFKTNMSLAIAIAGVLVHPEFMALMNKASNGDNITFATLTVLPVKYTYTIIPSLVMTWFLSYIEIWVEKLTPRMLSSFLKPMIIMLIAAPLAIIIVGPSGIWLGTKLSLLVFKIHETFGWLAVATMGGLWSLLVMTGTHRVFTPTIIQTIAQTGKESMVMPSELGANLSLGGAALAVAFKTKNSELRQVALAASASALIAGITEPALYGVALRLKRPLIAALISGFVCGAVAGIGGLSSFSMVAPGMLTSVQFYDASNPSSLYWIVGVIILSVVLSFSLTLLLGFDDIVSDDKIPPP